MAFFAACFVAQSELWCFALKRAPQIPRLPTMPHCRLLQNTPCWVCMQHSTQSMHVQRQFNTAVGPKYSVADYFACNGFAKHHSQLSDLLCCIALHPHLPHLAPCCDLLTGAPMPVRAGSPRALLVFRHPRGGGRYQAGRRMQGRRNTGRGGVRTEKG